MSEYFKYCIKCNSKRFFKTKKSFKNNKKDICLKCAMNSDDYREKQRTSKLGNKNGMYKKTHTIEVRKKISENTKIRMSIPQNIKNLKTRVWTNEQKIKHKLKINNPNRLKILREKRLIQIKKSGGIPSFNERACVFFDYLNKKLNWNGNHALNMGEKEILGYSVDYYNENIIIEWDEKRHNEPKNKQKDIIRQQTILKQCNYNFYRIDESNNKVYKVDNNISKDYTQIIQEILNEFKK